MFRGREQAHPERGRALLQQLFEDLGGARGRSSRQPLQEGRNMSMLLAPARTRQEEADGQAKADDSEADAPAPEGGAERSAA